MQVYEGKSYDEQYFELCRRIINEGEFDSNPRPKYEDGTPAHVKSVFYHTFTFEPNDIPLLFSKQVYVRQAIEEMLWIFRDRSNVVKDLQDKNVHIWDEWQDENGTIGKAYGYQLAQEVGHTGRNQVDNLIYNLKNNPESRRHIISLWNVEDIDDMMLTPCVWQTQWVVQGGKLHLEVMARSTDVALGLPFNVAQYWVLHKLIANEVGLDAGDMVFIMTTPHLYDRHIDTMQVQSYNYWCNLERMKDNIIEQSPIQIEIDDVGLYDFTMDNIRIKGYDNFGGEPLEKYSFEVGI